MGAAIIIYPNGDVTDLTLPTDTGENLAALREAIGCDMVDVVALTDRWDMWIDDEGLYTQPFNPVATELARRHGHVYQPYHGPVVLCGVTPEGASVDLSVDQVRALLTGLLDIAEEGTR